LKGGKLPTEKLKAQLQKIASSRTGGMKTDETLGKTGAGPEGLPHSIIVTAEGTDGVATLAPDGSPSVEPLADVPDEIQVEEKPPSSKPGKQAAKTMTGKKSLGKPATMPSVPKKGSSSQRHTDSASTGRKAHVIRKK
jgi:DNA topoisomerase-6 subunit B